MHEAIYQTTVYYHCTIVWIANVCDLFLLFTSVSETIRASVSVSTPRRPPNASTVTCFQSILLPVAMSTGVHAATTTSLTMCTPMYSTTRLPHALCSVCVCVCMQSAVCEGMHAVRTKYIAYEYIDHAASRVQACKHMVSTQNRAPSIATSMISIL
jgi:hypothetical protein